MASVARRAGVLLAAAAGCGQSASAPGVVTGFEPAVAYNDAAIAATVFGGPFRPAYRFDAESGSAGIELGGFSARLAPTAGAGGDAALSAMAWEAIDMVDGLIPAGVPPGFYDLFFTDPRGAVTRLPSAFESLGDDRVPPTLAITSPTNGSLFGAGALVPVVLQANDGYGSITSLQITTSPPAPAPGCRVPLQSTVSCAFAFAAPVPSANFEALTLTAVATDGGGNTASASVFVILVADSTVTSFSPAAGSTNGGTPVTVVGTGFLPGATTVQFGDRVADGYVASPTSFLATTPAHPPGRVAVTVTTSGASVTAASMFEYVPPPIVREISPARGPTAGGTEVTIVGDNFHQTTTQIWFGSAPMVAATVVSPNEIDGLSPPGNGTAIVSASDSIGGTAPSSVEFVYAGVDGGVAIGFAGTPTSRAESRP